MLKASIHPNPVKDIFTLKIHSDKTTNLDLTILDSGFRQIHKIKRLQLNNGNNSFDMNIDSVYPQELSSGVYFFKGESRQGNFIIKCVIEK